MRTPCESSLFYVSQYVYYIHKHDNWQSEQHGKSAIIGTFSIAYLLWVLLTVEWDHVGLMAELWTWFCLCRSLISIISFAKGIFIFCFCTDRILACDAFFLNRLDDLGKIYWQEQLFLYIIICERMILCQDGFWRCLKRLAADCMRSGSIETS